MFKKKSSDKNGEPFFRNMREFKCVVVGDGYAISSELFPKLKNMYFNFLFVWILELLHRGIGKTCVLMRFVQHEFPRVSWVLEILTFQVGLSQGNNMRHSFKKIIEVNFQEYLPTVFEHRHGGRQSSRHGALGYSWLVKN